MADRTSASLRIPQGLSHDFQIADVGDGTTGHNEWEHSVA